MPIKRPYQKPALSILEQIDEHKRQGMSFGDEAKAAELLHRVHHFRLRPYGHPFESDHINHSI